jgi:hypothetical protein
VGRWVEPLSEEGYTPLPGAIAILENLGGLEITPPTSAANLFYPDKITFDPVTATVGEFDRIQGWQRKYGVTFFPLGEYVPCFMLLFADDGRICGGRDQRLDLLGNGIEEALDLLILAKRLPVPFTK